MPELSNLFALSSDRSAASPVAGHSETSAHTMIFKVSLDASASPPDPGGLSQATGFSFRWQIYGASTEKQRAWFCLKCAGEDPQTALWKSSRWDWNLFSRTCQGNTQIRTVTFHLGWALPPCCLLPVHTELFGPHSLAKLAKAVHSCVWSGMIIERTVVSIDKPLRKKTNKVMIFHWADNSIWMCEPYCPRYSSLLERDWSNLSSIVSGFSN